MVAPVVGPVVAGGLSLAGGKSGQGRQKIARRTLREGRDQSIADLLPFMRAGKSGLKKFKRLAKGGFDFELEDDPGFNFIRDEALQAATRKLNAEGFEDSGNILAELQNRATGLASANVNDQFNRQLAEFNTNLGSLGRLVNLGTTGSQNIANIRNQVASNLANAYIGAAQQAQEGNQFVLESLNNAVQGGISNSLLSDLINRQNADPFFRGPR